MLINFMFPFLIGKVLTRSEEYTWGEILDTLFPFLIGKVLTGGTYEYSYKFHLHDVSIPYR